MRGFGYSEVAGDKSDPSQYSFVHQVRDIVSVLDAERLPQVLIVGHDWGGAVVWEFARRYPQRCYGVASLCTPYRPRNRPPPLLTVLKVAPNWVYMLVFAFTRTQAALNFEGDVGRALNFLIRSIDPQESVGLVKPLTALSLLTYLPLTAPRCRFWTAAEWSAQCQMFQWSGFLYPLLWYSTIRLNARQAKKTEAALGLPPLPSAFTYPQKTALTERVTVPALMMPAEGDGILQPVLSDGMEGWCDDVMRVDIRRAGHWALLEQPAQVNAALSRFIEHVQGKKR